MGDPKTAHRFVGEVAEWFKAPGYEPGGQSSPRSVQVQGRKS
jgi:hypothetical protein